ncbi:hypothetical protein [Mixta calida]|uniref:hypothetical protein n=1 Tax=Mixta calida TaxID=665913 RepID=UPI002908E808|nr:hypothetical protein [Mixta calida]MDU4288644.1 hypothetical protein [Mixta calida]
MKKDVIIKKATPDGKVAITMFADPEVANEIVRLAKEAAIEVIDGGNIESSPKSSSAIARVAEIAKSLEKQSTTFKPTLSERFNELLLSKTNGE